MKKIPMNVTNRLEIEGIQGFFVKTVTRFGTSAKVDCPMEFIGRTVYLDVMKRERTENSVKIVRVYLLKRYFCFSD